VIQLARLFRVRGLDLADQTNDLGDGFGGVGVDGIRCERRQITYIVTFPKALGQPLVGLDGLVGERWGYLYPLTLPLPLCRGRGDLWDLLSQFVTPAQAGIQTF